MRHELEYRFITERAEAIIKRYVFDAKQACSATGYYQALRGASGVWEYWADLIGLPGDVKLRNQTEHKDALRLAALHAPENVPPAQWSEN
jgi:hypothetical protein